LLRKHILNFDISAITVAVTYELEAATNREFQPIAAISVARDRLRFFFSLVQSQIAVWSLKRKRQLCMRTAHGIYRSCRREKLARIP